MVGVDGFGASVEAMEQAGQHVLSVNEAVQGDLTALRARLAPLGGAWKGEAATAFAGLMARWDADARALGDALRGIGEAIIHSGKGYDAMEQQSTSDMSTIRAALG